ncbi:hypothetical protein V8J88_04090 [Massilia sp. W12]|uniref:hypothetical protein n=1 Tax=Massilia sp. W12 TaxID=3126507 RepID=UPI0030CDCAF6
MFNYKDLTYIRVALLSHIDKLSAIEEDDPGVGEDGFSDIQDDIEYLQRLSDIVDHEIAAIKAQAVQQGARLTVVANNPPSD